MVVPLEVRIPEEWKDLASTLSGKGTIMVIGNVDVGKTTLSLFLCSELGLGLVDADIGQSTIGPPTLISYSSDPLTLKMEDAYFVGSITPEGHALEQVIGTWEMAKGRRAVIDTCGLVRGYLGYLLKVNKAKLINPEAIVAIGREGELDHILKELKEDFEVLEIPPSKYARKRGREERINRRILSFKRYFSEVKEASFRYELVRGFPARRIKEVSSAQAILGAKVYFLSLCSGSLYLACENPKEVRKLGEVFGASKVYSLSPSLCKGRILGITGRGGKFLGLGICSGIGEEGISAIVRKDLDEEKASSISFGELKLDMKGNHKIAKFTGRYLNVINAKGGSIW